MAQESDATNPAKKHASNFLLWWRVDPSELDRQVAEYATLSIWKSARRVSALLLIFSVVLTVTFSYFGWLGMGSDAFIDATIMLVLAAFVYYGKRWAIMAAMVYWTFAKIYGLFFYGINGGSAGGVLISSVLWWCFYMQQFFLAWRVENQRRKAQAPTSM